jgi:hypothetical protein
VFPVPTSSTVSAPVWIRRATDRARRSGQGLTTVVMFLLVPQVKLSKQLDVTRAAERWSAQLPALIEQQLRSE